MADHSVLWVNAEIYTPSTRIVNGRMLVGPGGRIEAVGGAEIDGREGTEIRDAGGKRLVPGFIDVHVHGGGGFSGMDGKTSLAGMSKYHASRGTTAFLATTVAADCTTIVSTLDQWRESAEEGALGREGANLIGMHLEGPFLNPARGGAQNPASLRKPDMEEMDRYLEVAGRWIRMVTIAPELEGAERVIRRLAERNVTVSAGHTDATYEQMREAARLGVTHVTHHFNGMSPLKSREPGVTGAGLRMPELTIELIADGYHIHPEMIALAFDAKPTDRIVLVTDAMLCAGCPDGLYETEGIRIRMSGGKVTLADGTSLAGSGLDMLAAFRNAIAFTGLPTERILPTLTSVPARQAGVADRKGRLAAGMDADFLLLDAEWNLIGTYVGGREVFRRKESEEEASERRLGKSPP
ncbi:N-acetylglucosamine-6-phosphate deacetylase [Paenibacillus antri]|uniref:N-acetylglucosamine-6-phosphate deacetylase n=1 Tax=Paenibacillus antri TaxID=2582848 RepID=A0A5R9GKY1_9BACL|nr:N-acetylglucosamine-6-phosphate deacetylase [Paenibacillus antri]TLS52415.1 N-acetylglucosamine-6-phosphate deacetylase [Paenibacillus antri]